MVKHEEAKAFAAKVLWLIGHSERKIAQRLNMRRGHVASIVGRSAYRDRAAMGNSDRQAELDYLWGEHRLIWDDFHNKKGRLEAGPWKIMPLR